MNQTDIQCRNCETWTLDSGGEIVRCGACNRLLVYREPLQPLAFDRETLEDGSQQLCARFLL